jgi:hypothetical protein
VAAFRDRLAPGSYLVISAGQRNELNRPTEGRVQAAYGSRTILSGRPASEIAAYFGDFELLPPGLVPVTDWPAAASDPPLPPPKAGMLAAIGRKPHHPE